jgi:hypothetical protein
VLSIRIISTVDMVSCKVSAVRTNEVDCEMAALRKFATLAVPTHGPVRLLSMKENRNS